MIEGYMEISSCLLSLSKRVLVCEAMSEKGLSGTEFQERFLNCLWFITVLNEEHFGQVQLCSGFFGFSI